jgi:hypothetical protein
MTQRDRQASAQNTPAALREARSRTGALLPEAAAAVKFPAPVWEQIFRAAAPAERERLLALAGRQGVLFSHQLPDSPGVSNGDHPAHAQVLSGRLDHWTPVRVQPITPRDAELDANQREAVAKALQTPDLCLIQGLPGTGKRRVAAEIIHQAVARGERVLLLAPQAGAIDVLLEAIAAGDSTLVLRCLDPKERPELLSESIRRFTFREQLEDLQQALHLARRKAREAGQRREQRKRQVALWPQLQESTAGLETLAVREEAFRQRALQADQARREACAAESGLSETGRTAFQSVLLEALRPAREALSRAEDAVAECGRRVTAVQQERADRLGVINPLRRLTDARKSGRWWSPLWWKALFVRDLETQLAQFDAEEAQARGLLAELGERHQELTREQERLRHAVLDERDRLIEVETVRRRAEMEAEEDALRLARTPLEARWQDARAGFGDDSVFPGARTQEAVAAAHQAWRELVEHEELCADFAGEWADALEQAADHLDRRLRDYASVVAATVGGLSTDEHFGNSVLPARPFDLLILLDAHTVGETEFARVAGRANRSVLIGESVDLRPGEEVVRTSTSDKTSIPSSFLQRLWTRLHCDPRRLPYTWFREHDRLCCRLRLLASEQRRWVESEPLADFPEIELRILAPPRKPSQLVEILFPAGLSIHQAKEFIFKELHELPIATSGRGIRWEEQPDRMVLHLTNEPLSLSQPIPLEPGLRERIGTPALIEGNGEARAAPDWQTCCLEFDRSAGWDRCRAEEWVHHRLGLRDLGRTAWLNKPYRMQPDLARLLSHLLFDGQYEAVNTGHPNGDLVQTATHAASSGPPVEFIPVTAYAEVATARPRLSDGPLFHHGGGRSVSSTAAREKRLGLELNLGVCEQRKALPEDLRAVLPTSGIVNVVEAQAVVHALEALVNNRAVRVRAADPGPEKRPVIGVVALYAAQVELIRRLIEQVPTLLATDVAILVETPETIRYRECCMTLVSLTRSHPSQAVSVGDGPQRLIWAMTRSTTRLLIFGDPATLQRRCQWDGPVAPLDGGASRREREILSNLVQYLDGAGVYPRAFHLREGGWT